MTLTEQELVRVIGYDETLKLETIYRSQFIYIGPESAPIKDIKEKISNKAAQALVNYMAGDHLWVPATIYRQERNEKIFNEIARCDQEQNPLTMKELAGRFNIKTRAIRQILQRHKEGSKHE